MIDIDASSTWWLGGLPQFRPVSIDGAMTPPKIIESSRADKGVRVNTLMCPYAGVNYTCELDSAVIVASATTSTEKMAISVGGSVKTHVLCVLCTNAQLA